MYVHLFCIVINAILKLIFSSILLTTFHVQNCVLQHQYFYINTNILANISRIAMGGGGTSGGRPVTAHSSPLPVRLCAVWGYSVGRGLGGGGAGAVRGHCACAGGVCGRVMCLCGGPLLVKLVVEVFGRVMRMRVHTWRLRGGLLVLAAVAGRAAAVRRPLTPHTTHRTRGRATVATRGRRYFTSCIHGPLTC